MSSDQSVTAASASPDEDPRSDSPLDKVLRRIGRTQDFPAISKYVIEINKKLSENTMQSSASDLANMILKDYALTNKLLKLVNSAFYGFLTCKVTTVTRAVVVLGYDNVRLAAVSLLLFDHFKSRSEALDLKDAAISSFWCGLISKEIAKLQGEIDPEEAFICALLHQLGTLLTIHHLPQAYREIRSRLSQGGNKESQVVKQVLGISYDALGLAVARQWSFPESILKTMEPLSPEALAGKKGGIAPLCAVANFADALRGIITTIPESRKKAIKELLQRYKNHISISAKQLRSIMDASQESLRKHADALQFSVKQSEFMSRLANDQATPPKAESDIVIDEVPRDQRDKQTNAHFTDDADPSITAPETHAEDAVSILMSGVQEVSHAMTGAYKVNEIALMSVEVIYRAVKCQRALLFIHDGHRRILEARFGYGAGIQYLVGKVSFSTDVTATPDLFSQALKKGKDLLLEDAHAPQLHPLLPAWYRRYLDAKALLFMPVIYQNICVAAYYADFHEGGSLISDFEHEHLSLLRDQLILAIKNGR